MRVVSFRDFVTVVCLLTITATGRAEDLSFTMVVPPVSDFNAGESVPNRSIVIGSPPALSADFPQPLCCTCNQTCSDESSGLEKMLGCFSGCQVKFVPYGWLFEVHGQSTVRGVSNEIDLTTREMLNLLEHNVHFVFSGQLELQNGSWGLIINGFYVNAGFGNQIRRFDFSANYKQAIVDVTAAYALEGMPDFLCLPAGSRVELLAGGRYWMLDGGVTVTGPMGGTASANGEREWVDPIVGSRITMPISSNLGMQFRADVGGFDWGNASKFTWNVEAMIQYRCSESCSLLVGYRLLDVDYTRDSGNERFALDAQFRGPVAGLAIEF